MAPQQCWSRSMTSLSRKTWRSSCLYSSRSCSGASQLFLVTFALPCILSCSPAPLSFGPPPAPPMACQLLCPPPEALFPAFNTSCHHSSLHCNSPHWESCPTQTNDSCFLYVAAVAMSLTRACNSLSRACTCCSCTQVHLSADLADHKPCAAALPKKHKRFMLFGYVGGTT